MMNRTIHILSVSLILSAAAAALSACVVGPNFHRPDAPSSAGYAMSGDQAAPTDVALGATTAGPWWTVFDSAQLDRTMDQAFASNPTLAVANANLAQARSAMMAARAGLFPEIDANAGVQRERLNFSSFGFSGFPGLSNNPEFSLYSVGATASYALPTSGGTKRTIESAAARAEAIEVRGGGTYVCMEGPQFSSLAESLAYKAAGYDVIGMTAMPEAKLAREAELGYAIVAMVTDFDCWHPHHDAVDVAAIIAVIQANAGNAARLVARLLRDMPAEHEPCPQGSDRALDTALITAPEARDPALLQKLATILARVTRR